MNTSSQQTISPRFHGAALFFLVSFAIVSYSNTIQVPFTFDDYGSIVANEALHLKDFSWQALKEAAPSGVSRYRWFPNISFALNYYYAGLDVRPYHLVNLCIHVLSGITLYFLALATFRQQGVSLHKSYAPEAALLAALIWTVHPVQTNAVTYIVQRMASMAALFSLASLLFYILGRDPHRNRGQKLGLWALSMIAAVMALLSKENAAMLPVMIAGYDLFFLRRGEALNAKKISLAMLIGLGALVCISLLLLGTSPFDRLFSGYEFRPFTPIERLLTQPRVIVHYLSLLVLPLPSRLNLNYDFAVSSALFSPGQTILALAALAGMILLAATFFKRDRLLSFALFWFCGNLLIESSLIPLELVYEHRLYLPSAFLSIAAVAFCFQKAGRRANLLRWSLFTVAAILVLLTFQRNRVWQSELSLWSDVVAKSENLARPHSFLGYAYGKQGNMKEAEKHLSRAMDLGIEDAKTYVLLGLIKESKGEFRQAVRLCREALGMRGKTKELVTIHNALGRLYLKLKENQDAISEARITLHVSPDHPEAMKTLGIALNRTGAYEEAYQYLDKALRSLPADPDVVTNIGIAAIQLEMIDDGISFFKQAVELAPQSPEFHYNLGLAYKTKGMDHEAQLAMERAEELKNQQ